MKDYIFTEIDGRGWYIERYRSIEEAKANCRSGWSVEQYTTTRQLYW